MKNHENFSNTFKTSLVIKYGKEEVDVSNLRNKGSIHFLRMVINF